MVTIHHPLVDSITCLRKKPWYLYRNSYDSGVYHRNLGFLEIRSTWSMDRTWCGCLLPSVVVINVFMVSSVPYFYAVSEGRFLLFGNKGTR